MTLFKGEYRVESARHPEWDYARHAAYFITICTANRNCYFGHIVEQQMQLSEIGLVAVDWWEKIAVIYPKMNLLLDVFVVMPNHFHAIVVIGENEYNLTSRQEEPTVKFGPQKYNLAAVIRGYKSAVTAYARKNLIAFEWQSRFHDRIIRNADEYERIRSYIASNPEHWDTDRYNVR